MKLTVKTLKGTQFEIKVQPSDSMMAVKKNIEEVQGKDSFPCGQQLLIHNGKVLKDESTLEENKVGEDGFLVVMLSKSKASGSSGASSVQPSGPPAAREDAPPVTPVQAPVSAGAATVLERAIPEVSSDAYGQAASNLVSGSNVDLLVNQLMEMGGGSWDRELVLQALRAAYNNPERAVDYLYSGIPVTADIPAPIPASSQGASRTESAHTGESQRSAMPNSSPLNLFPQEAGAGGESLNFLRHNQRFEQLRQMVQSNPQILQPMLQELSKQNPQLLRLIQANHDEFLQLLNEPLEGGEEDFLDQPEQDEMPHSISVTPTEQEAIGRLEAMGFNRSRVIEAFLACDRNEELAANYLLEHAADED